MKGKKRGSVGFILEDAFGDDDVQSNLDSNPNATATDEVDNNFNANSAPDSNPDATDDVDNNFNTNSNPDSNRNATDEVDNNFNANSAPDPNAKYRKAYDEYPDCVKESYSFDLYLRLVAKCNKMTNEEYAEFKSATEQPEAQDDADVQPEAQDEADAKQPEAQDDADADADADEHHKDDHHADADEQPEAQRDAEHHVDANEQPEAEDDAKHHADANEHSEAERDADAHAEKRQTKRKGQQDRPQETKTKKAKTKKASKESRGRGAIAEFQDKNQQRAWSHILTYLPWLFNTFVGFCVWVPTLYASEEVVMVSMKGMKWIVERYVPRMNSAPVVQVKKLFEKQFEKQFKGIDFEVDFRSKNFFDALLRTPFRPGKPHQNANLFFVCPVGIWKTFLKELSAAKNVVSKRAFEISSNEQMNSARKFFGQEYAFTDSNYEEFRLRSKEMKKIGLNGMIPHDDKVYMPAFGSTWWRELFSDSIRKYFEMGDDLRHVVGLNVGEEAVMQTFVEAKAGKA